MLVISVSTCGILSPSLAATCVITASANAGRPVTSDNSIHSAACTTIVPSSLILNFSGFTPTDTESMTPSRLSWSASSAREVLLKRAENIIPSLVSTRSVTMPTACSESWLTYSFGALPSVGRLPASNMTFVPSLTVAATPYGTATPETVRDGTPSTFDASRVRSCEISFNMFLV